MSQASWAEPVIDGHPYAEMASGRENCTAEAADSHDRPFRLGVSGTIIAIVKLTKAMVPIYSLRHDMNSPPNDEVLTRPGALDRMYPSATNVAIRPRCALGCQPLRQT